MALEAQFAPLRALATPPAQTAASPVSERGRVSRTHSTENLMTTVRSVHKVVNSKRGVLCQVVYLRSII